MFSRLGPMELVLIFAIVLLIVGPSRLPDMAKSMGQALRSFRSETKELTDVAKEVTNKE